MEITTTEIWMFGIIALMVLFGIFAVVFSSMGKNYNSN